MRVHGWGAKRRAEPLPGRVLRSNAREGGEALGTGKTHAATALGAQAVEHHRRKIRFFSTIELVNALEQEKAKGKTGQLAEGLTKLDLVILEELGYQSFSAYGGA